MSHPLGERMARIELVQLRCLELQREGEVCVDPCRLRAIADELGVLVASMIEIMIEIRREQLVEQLALAAAPRWWRRLVRRGSSS